MTNWVQMTPGVKRRIIADGERLMLVEVHFEPNSAVAMHFHVHEQVAYIQSGRMRFVVDGKRLEVGAGETVHLPSNVPHSAESLDEPCVIIDTFSPPREDFRV
jgi:quercetin dioxygenase-like cupin family protein